MGYYPIFVEMTDRPCAVVGGGVVAERKAQALLEIGARVTVISPDLAPRLRAWAPEKKLEHVAREYHAGDLAGFEMVFVATDDGGVNAAVAREGRERGVWVNCADDPAHCDFILPSVLRRGELVVAVATGGASPAVARAIREEMESYITADCAELVRVAAEARSELRERSVSPSAQAWSRALTNGFRKLIAEGRLEEAKSYLLKELETASCK